MNGFQSIQPVLLLIKRARMNIRFPLYDGYRDGNTISDSLEPQGRKGDGCNTVRHVNCLQNQTGL